MAIQNTGSQGWKAYKPSKTMWFWSSVACVGLTVLVGFTWGGWRTGGSAERLAEDAGETAQAQLAAVVCEHQFMQGPDARDRLAELQETASHSQRRFVEDGGWTNLAGMEKPVAGAAALCAAQLATVDLALLEEAPPALATTEETVEPETVPN